jgi:hypothetical protein
MVMPVVGRQVFTVDALEQKGAPGLLLSTYSSKYRYRLQTIDSLRG